MLTDKIEIYFDSFEAKEKSALGEFHKIIVRNDPKVGCVIARVMSIERGLVYHEKGVFKYALAKTKGYYTIHNMVMYAYPEIRLLFETHRQSLKGLRFQKGCINFKDPEDFPLEVFAMFIKKSAQMDFSRIIERYHQS